jgi:hypothetical protein
VGGSSQLVLTPGQRVSILPLTALLDESVVGLKLGRAMLLAPTLGPSWRVDLSTVSADRRRQGSEHFHLHTDRATNRAGSPQNFAGVPKGLASRRSYVFGVAPSLEIQDRLDGVLSRSVCERAWRNARSGRGVVA